MAEANDFYVASRTGPLRQGEILSDLKQIVPIAGSVFHELRVDIIEHPFAVVLSQDCDLEQDFYAREGLKNQKQIERPEINERRKLSSVLFCDATPTDELRNRINDARVWKTVLQNMNERYQFLREIKPGQDASEKGVPSGLGLDFKRYFSIPTEEVYAQAEQLKNRRGILQTPYAEHLNVRFHFYQMRIALPKAHHAD